MAGGASRSLFQPLVLLVAAVVLLDQNRRPPALLETLLLVVRPELGLDQDGRLSHLLVESVLREQSRSVSAGGRTRQEVTSQSVFGGRWREEEGWRTDQSSVYRYQPIISETHLLRAHFLLFGQFRHKGAQTGQKYVDATSCLQPDLSWLLDSSDAQQESVARHVSTSLCFVAQCD